MSKEKVQISPVQLTFLVITLVISTADIFLPVFVAKEAKNDSWLSPIFATIAMAPIVWIQLKLYRLNEGKTLIEICRGTTGKVIGTVIGILYVFYFFLIAFAVINEMNQVLNTAFLPLTPPVVFVVISMCISAYAVGRDIEVISRVNEILLPIGIGALGFLMLVNIKEMDLSFFRPVLNNGFVPPLLGSLVIVGWLSQIVVFLQFAHFVSVPDKLGRAVYAGLLFNGAGILVGSLIYALFGPLTEILMIPALEFARFASIGKYLKGLDIIVMSIWVTGIYVKIMVFYYAGTYALGQLINSDSYKPLIIPAGIMISCMAVASGERIVESMYFLHYIYPLYSLIMSLVIPGVLLAVSLLTKKKKGNG